MVNEFVESMFEHLLANQVDLQEVNVSFP